MMKRTQMYFEEDVMSAMQARAREMGLTVSELVRRAVRDRYLGQSDKRKAAMMAVVGLRKNLPEDFDSTAYIRDLRQGTK
jgi:hypothetical protein